MWINRPTACRGSRRAEPCQSLRNYSDDYAKLTCYDWTLRYYYEGEEVACRGTPEGVEVLAVGPEEVGRFYQDTLP